MVEQRKLALTGAHYGLKDWLIQRITAVLMVSYVVFMTIFIFLNGPYQDFSAWKDLFQRQEIRIPTFFFWLCVFWHAWVGVRNILMDYVHGISVRLLLQIVVIISLLFYVIWIADILWNIGS